MIKKNYSGEKKFKGKDLTHNSLSFYKCCIRGTDFSNATLCGVDFSGAQAGIQKSWMLLLLISSCSLIFLAEFTAVISGFIATYWLTPEALDMYTIVPALGMIGLLSLVFSLTIFKGALSGLITVAVIGALGLASTVAFAGVIPLAKSWAIIIPITSAGSFGAVGWVVAISLAISITWSVAEWIGLCCIFVSWLTSILIAVSWSAPKNGAIYVSQSFGAGSGEGVWWLAIIASVILFCIGGYIAYQSMKEAERFKFIRNISIAITSFGGTNFSGADLTGAIFDGADLKNTNFTCSNLTRTSWKGARNINFSLISSGSYLEKVETRTLLVNQKSDKKDFQNYFLKGVNLEGANLQGINFIGSDMSDSNLRSAHLEKAKLDQVQLDGADLSNAFLTGAFICNWNITSETVLEDINCKYTFMRIPTDDDPDPNRKPDDKHSEFNSENDDFADFIRPLTGTLDLYHNKKIDPRAFAVSFQKLVENNPDAELQIVAMEKRGNEKFLVRAIANKSFDLSSLSGEYFSSYETEIEKLKGEIERKDKSITDKENTNRHLVSNLSTMISLFNDEINKKLSNSPMPEQPKSHTINNYIGQVANLNQAELMLTKNQNISQNNCITTPEETAAVQQIKKSLEQLQEQHPNATNEELLDILQDMPQQDPHGWQSWRAFFSVVFAGGSEATKIFLPIAGIPIEVAKRLYEIYQKNKHLSGK